MKKARRYIGIILTEFIYGGHLLSLGAAGIVLAVVFLLDLKFNFVIIAIPYLISQVVYSYNHFHEIEHDMRSNPERTLHMKKQRGLMRGLLLVYIFSLVGLLLLTNFETYICVLFIAIGGVLYTDYFKDMLSTRLAGFKNFYTSIFWAILIIIIPLFYDLPITSTYLYLFLFIFLRLLVNTAFFDIKDIEDDRQRGLKTFPVLFGKKRTIVLLEIINIFSAVPIIIGVNNGSLSKLSLALIILILYSVYYLTQGLLLEDKKLRILSYIVVDGEYLFWPILIILGKTVI